MSQPTEVNEALHRYVAEHTRRDDAFLRDLRTAARTEGLPPIDLDPTAMRLVTILLAAAGAKEVVEVGTLGGYSAISMARALPRTGRVRTIEVEPTHAEFARRWVNRSDVSGKVEVLLGRGLDVLATFAAASADAAMVDADKESYPAYLEQLRRVVKPGGLIFIDNAFAFGQLLDGGSRGPEVEAIRKVNDQVAQARDLDGVLVPLGDGLWVIRVTGVGCR